MKKIPWDPEVYGLKDQEAADRCSALLEKMGFAKREGFVPTGGAATQFLSVLCDYGWCLPNLHEVERKFPLDLLRPAEELRAPLEERITWEAKVALVAAGIDDRTLNVEVSSGDPQRPRGRVLFMGRHGAFRAGTCAGGIGLDLAHQLGLPGCEIYVLRGRVKGALDRSGIVCLPDDAAGALGAAGLIEFAAAGEGADADTERHNRVGFWAGNALRHDNRLLDFAWKEV